MCKAFLFCALFYSSFLGVSYAAQYQELPVTNNELSFLIQPSLETQASYEELRNECFAQLTEQKLIPVLAEHLRVPQENFGATQFRSLREEESEAELRLKFSTPDDLPFEAIFRLSASDELSYLERIESKEPIHFLCGLKALSFLDVYNTSSANLVGKRQSNFRNVFGQVISLGREGEIRLNLGLKETSFPKKLGSNFDYKKFN